MERKRKRRQRCICTNGAVILLLLAMSASSFGVDSNNPSLFPDTVSSVDAALDWDSRRDRNCFAAVESQTWASLNVIVYNKSLSRISIFTDRAGPGVRGCLEKQDRENQVNREQIGILHLYRIDLIDQNDHATQSKLISTSKLLDENDQVKFNYLIHPGDFRIHIQHCQQLKHHQSPDCSQDGVLGVTSPVAAKITKSLVKNWCQDSVTNSSAWFSSWVKVIQKTKLEFAFYYPSCVSGLPFPYEQANATLLRTLNKTLPCQLIPGQVEKVNSSIIKPHISKLNDDIKILTLKTETIPDDYFYCLKIHQNDHVLCQGDKNAHFCQMSSEWMYLDPLPLIHTFFPYCHSHMRCAWIYLTFACSIILFISCCLAFCCVRCICRLEDEHKSSRINARRDEDIPFQGLSMPENVPTVIPRKTWDELHSEWDTQPPKNPGKILLLYSPDSNLFKDLQSSLKSFLETACHCIVLDLFDEELFESIAFNPEQWLSNLLKDPDFKIIIICSRGAFKRQQSLLNGEVLNIPENTAISGLFSAGLKFIQEQHAYDYNRLALARYELLALTSPDCRLQEMVPNKEFLIPTQLHELFCWIHGYDPLDLLGKPWDRYHLEWQLLTDVLKKVRMERK